MNRIRAEQLKPLISAVGQRRIAESIGVSQSLISLWLSGERSLSDDKQRLLATCLRSHVARWQKMLREMK